MTPFQRAHIPESEIERVATDIIRKCESEPEFALKMFGTNDPALIRERVYNLAHEESGGEVWKNDTYQVVIRRAKARTKGAVLDVIHLSLKRIDKGSYIPWTDIQQIKNELVGPEHEGAELYPAESRLVNTANQRHIWILPEPNMRFPFGFWQRAVSDESIAGSKNDPLENK